MNESSICENEKMTLQCYRKYHIATKMFFITCDFIIKKTEKTFNICIEDQPPTKKTSQFFYNTRKN